MNTNTPAPAATAARAIAAAMIRHTLTVAGTALVAHGWVDQDTASAATSPIADEVLGLLLVGVSAAWRVLRAADAHPMGGGMGGAARAGREMIKRCLTKAAHLSWKHPAMLRGFACAGRGPAKVRQT